MRVKSSHIFNLIRSAAFSAVAAIFLVGNLTAAEQLSSAAGKQAAKATISLQLHKAPVFHGSAQGLRESSPEEVQRIEELGARQKFSRHENIDDLLSGVCLAALNGNASLKPLLLLESACSQANLISFAHAYLTARYPIPPPFTLH